MPIADVLLAAPRPPERPSALEFDPSGSPSSRGRDLRSSVSCPRRCPARSGRITSCQPVKGSLAISGGASGSQLSISVAGASSGSYAILVVGEQAGSTQVPLPIGGSLVLGIAEPFFPVPIGMADMAGAVSLQLQIPANLPGQLSLQAQAVSLGYSLMPFAIRACASNVVPVTIG